MFEQLQSLALGIGIFALILGVVSVVLTNFGASVGGTANTTVQYLLTQLGSTGGGLATWTGAVIAVGVGFLLIYYFAGRGGKRK